MPEKVVLAYSGGLDTSIIIPWLRETYGCAVVAVAVSRRESNGASAKRHLALKNTSSATPTRATPAPTWTAVF